MILLCGGGESFSVRADGRRNVGAVLFVQRAVDDGAVPQRHLGLVRTREAR